MSVICWSSHPVWCILETLNLPPEIIIKIFRFKTVLMSPTMLPMNEFSELRKKHSNSISCYYTRHCNLLELFITQLFDETVPYERCFNLTDLFLTYNQKFKPKSKGDIFKKYITFIEDYKQTSEDPIDTYIELSNCLQFDYKKDLMETMLFTICTNEYYFTIISIFNSENINNQVETNMFDDRVTHSSWGIQYFWKYMIYSFINKTKVNKNKLSIINRKINITHRTLIKWCNILGIKHYHSWTKSQLIGSIFKNEPTKFDPSYC